MKNLIQFICFMLCLGISTANAQIEWVNVFTTEDGKSLTHVDFLDENHGVAVGEAGLVVITSDAGENWDILNTPYDDDLEGVEYLDENVIVAVGHNGRIMRTMDGGVMWEDIDHPAGSVILYDVDIDPETNGGLIAGMGNLIMWTSDGGQSWEYIDGGYMNSYYGAFMNDNDFGIAVGKNAIMQPLLGYTDDGGETWDYRDVYPVFGTTAYEGTAYDAYFFNANDGFVAGTTWDGIGFVTVEVDWNSNSWQAAEFSSPLNAIDFANDEFGMVAGYEGYMAETHNGGISWDDVVVKSDRLPGTFQDIELFESTGYAVTDNGEVYKRVNTTSSEDDENPSQSLKIYPNPSEGASITLLLETPDEGNYNIAVTSLKGQTMFTEMTGNLQKGVNHISIDISNLEAGIYFVSVKNQDVYYTEKLIVR